MGFCPQIEDRAQCIEKTCTYDLDLKPAASNRFVIFLLLKNEQFQRYSKSLVNM